MIVKLKRKLYTTANPFAPTKENLRVKSINERKKFILHKNKWSEEKEFSLNTLKNDNTKTK